MPKISEFTTGINLTEYTTDLMDGIECGFDADFGYVCAYKGKVIPVDDLPKGVKLIKLKKPKGTRKPRMANPVPEKKQTRQVDFSIQIMDIDGQQVGDRFLKIAYGIKLNDVIPVEFVTKETKTRSKEQTTWYHVKIIHRDPVLGGYRFGKEDIVRIQETKCKVLR